MSEIDALVSDLENADGPSRKINTFLWLEFIEKPDGKRDQDMIGKEPNYTGCIEDAFAFASKVLPDANCYGVERDKFGWSAYMSRNNVSDGHWLVEGGASTAPIAILIATFLALKEKTEKCHPTWKTK